MRWRLQRCVVLSERRSCDRRRVADLASGRRACTLFSVARSALKYRSRKATEDAPVIERMTELSAQYPRYGYRRVEVLSRLVSDRGVPQ